jgi:membrane protein YqaA with SNARE-associated domain
MLEWIFDGIGSELISVLIGLVLGGGAGYYIGVTNTTNKIMQKQKAGDNAKQEQIGQVNNYGTK